MSKSINTYKKAINALKARVGNDAMLFIVKHRDLHKEDIDVSDFIYVYPNASNDTIAKTLTVLNYDHHYEHYVVLAKTTKASVVEILNSNKFEICEVQRSHEIIEAFKCECEGY